MKNKEMAKWELELNKARMLLRTEPMGAGAIYLEWVAEQKLQALIDERSTILFPAYFELKQKNG